MSGGAPDVIAQLYPIFLESTGVSTDTRSLRAGEIYFALSGPNFNGNAFAQQALDAGARLAVVDDDAVADVPGVFRVADVLATMQALARHHRRQVDPVVLGITGSNGKTTSKELIREVLAGKFRVWATKGNLNNHIGVPLTLLQMPADTEIAVVEMGMNAPGEIAELCRIAEPACGVITNVGKAHLQGLGSLDGVRRAKGELYDWLQEIPEGLVFVHHSDDMLMPMTEPIASRITYGSHPDADVVVTTIQGYPLEVEAFGLRFGTRLFGAYNTPNVALALTIGAHFGVAVEVMQAALAAYIPGNQRSELRAFRGAMLVVDAYNANPTSMLAALDSFAAWKVARKWVVLGDMYELGEHEAEEHQRILDRALALEPELLITVGQRFPSHAEVQAFSDSSSFGQWLAQQDLTGVHMLLKASRSVGLETALVEAGP